MAAKDDLRRPDRLLRRALHELFGASHRVVVVGVGLVPLEHRELRRVLVGDALVAEVLGDLVDLLEAADDQPLEVQLVGDAQVDVPVEIVGMRHERLGERAAVLRLQDRRLDLDEAGSVQVRADGRNHPGANERIPAGLLVHQ